MWAEGFWAEGFWAEGFWAGYSDSSSDSGITELTVTDNLTSIELQDDD